MADILRHLRAHAGIVDPDHGQLWWQAQLHQLVDAGADIEQGLEPRLLVDKGLRRRPGNSVVRRWRSIAVDPGIDLRARQMPAQGLKPLLRLARRITERHPERAS